MKDKHKILIGLSAYICLIVIVRAYDVIGSTLGEVASHFHKPYAAEVTWTPTVEGTMETTSLPQQNTGECLFQAFAKVKSYNVQITTTKELPSWTNINDAPCLEIKAEWNRFIAAANVHEDGHIAIVENFRTNDLPGYISRAKALTADGSGSTQEAANADAETKLEQKMDLLGKEAMGDLQAKSDTYDNNTNHGATQGALLDTNVVCPPSTPKPTSTPNL
jgi:hypothetical protein